MARRAAGTVRRAPRRDRPGQRDADRAGGAVARGVHSTPRLAADADSARRARSTLTVRRALRLRRVGRTRQAVGLAFRQRAGRARATRVRKRRARVGAEPTSRTQTCNALRAVSVGRAIVLVGIVARSDGLLDARAPVRTRGAGGARGSAEAVVAREVVGACVVEHARCAIVKQGALAGSEHRHLAALAAPGRTGGPAARAAAVGVAAARSCAGRCAAVRPVRSAARLYGERDRARERPARDDADPSCGPRGGGTSQGSRHTRMLEAGDVPRECEVPCSRSRPSADGRLRNFSRRHGRNSVRRCSLPAATARRSSAEVRRLTCVRRVHRSQAWREDCAGKGQGRRR
jgi:hypothetical protein